MTNPLAGSGTTIRCLKMKGSWRLFVWYRHRYGSGFLAVIMGFLWLGGCGLPGEPYVPIRRSWLSALSEDADPEPPVIRYSSYWNSPEQVRDVVRELCGDRVIAAYLTERPYRGTLLHPQELEVQCRPDPKLTDEPGGRRDDGFWFLLADPHGVQH